MVKTATVTTDLIYLFLQENGYTKTMRRKEDREVNKWGRGLKALENQVTEMSGQIVCIRIKSREEGKEIATP